MRKLITYILVDPIKGPMIASYRGYMKGEVGRLVLAWFLTAFSTGTMSYSLPYYIVEVLRFPGWVMGFVITLTGLIMVIFSWPFGYISDKYGRRKVFISGGIFSCIAILLFAYIESFEQLLLAALLSGLSGAMFGSSYNALLADKAKSDSRAFSLSFFAGTIGMSIGGFFLSVLYPLQGFTGSSLTAHRVLFLSMAILGLGSPILAVTISKESYAEKREPFILPRRSAHVLVPFLIASSLIALGAGMIVPLMPYWFSLKFMIDDSISGPILGFSTLLTAISFLYAPRLAYKVGHVKAIVLSQGISTVFLVYLPFTPAFIIAGIIYAIRTLLMNMANPLQTSLIMGLVDERERGLASGLSSAFWRLPHSISSYFGAYLMSNGMVDLPFFICALLYITSISFFWMKFKKFEPKMREMLIISSSA